MPSWLSWMLRLLSSRLRRWSVAPSCTVERCALRWRATSCRQSMIWLAMACGSMISCVPPPNSPSCLRKSFTSFSSTPLRNCSAVPNPWSPLRKPDCAKRPSSHRWSAGSSSPCTLRDIPRSVSLIATWSVSFLSRSYVPRRVGVESPSVELSNAGSVRLAPSSSRLPERTTSSWWRHSSISSLAMRSRSCVSSCAISSRTRRSAAPMRSGYTTMSCVASLRCLM
mmetsp:Transcript_11252/g.29302  ORF Transcript_11252/g.29302 Transcript_11252/m.29302 type:complete len:225 (-) Transcript_11252:620-1294(-)